MNSLNNYIFNENILNINLKFKIEYKTKNYKDYINNLKNKVEIQNKISNIKIKI